MTKHALGEFWLVQDADLLDMAFNAKKADARKEPSLTHLDPERMSFSQCE